MVLEFGSQPLEQMTMASPFGDIHSAFSLGVPESTPSALLDQAPNNLNWRTVPSRLMKGRVPG